MTLLIFQLVYLCNNNRWFKKVVERGRKEIKKKKKKRELRFLARVSSRGRRYFLSFLFPLSFERNNLVRVNFVSRREFFFFFFFAAVYTSRGCKRRNSWRTCEVRHGRECINTIEGCNQVGCCSRERRGLPIAVEQPLRSRSTKLITWLTLVSEKNPKAINHSDN